jgi:hypothetical protein
MADGMGKSKGGQQMNRPDSGMMNVSAYPMIDSNKWDLWGSATLWQAQQEGTDWAYEDRNEEDKVVFKHVDFEWEWGFKVGIGYNMMKHDEWDTQFYYTWFRANEEANAGLPVGRIIPLYMFNQEINGSDFKSGEIHWKINYNMFDWELGRGYMVSKHLALRPHVGVKGGWIYQNLHGHFTAFSNERAAYKAKNHFWGVGPSGGINTKWELGNWETHFFSLFGDFSGAWMYGHWNVSHEYQDSDLVEVEFENLGRNLGAVTLQAFIGFGWDTNFNDDQCHFSMRLGYEVQHWFNQLKFFPPGDLYRYNFDLTLQGGTLDVRFDF